MSLSLQSQMEKAEHMEHQEGFFTGARGKQIYYQSWLPEGEPKAVLLVIHGLAEHCGRYMNIVDYFTPRGYAVYGLDHIGHGKSEGTRVYVERFEEYITTTKTFFDMVQNWQPGKLVFLVGHSMGSLIGAVYLLEYQDELAGAIISGTMVKVPDHVTSTTVTMGKIFSTLLPKFGIVGVEADHISSDPAVIDAYVNDPLVYIGKSTARLAAEMLKAMQDFPSKASQITLPITIVQGGEDKIVNVNDAQILYDMVGSTDKTVKIYDGYEHEVFNEPGRDVVFADIYAWLEAHLD
jgi:alpha-beta hydrolase superfamily lysophospholipase